MAKPGNAVEEKLLRSIKEEGLLPQEQFDLTQFWEMSEEHALKAATLGIRKLVSYTITFSTTVHGLSVRVLYQSDNNPSPHTANNVN